MPYTKDDLKNLYYKFAKKTGKHSYHTKFPGMLLAASYFDPNLFFSSLEKNEFPQNLSPLFHTDFKNLPLYTNSADFAVKAIVNWRLQLGK